MKLHQFLLTLLSLLTLAHALTLPTTDNLANPDTLFKRKGGGGGGGKGGGGKGGGGSSGGGGKSGGGGSSGGSSSGGSRGNTDPSSNGGGRSSSGSGTRPSYGTGGRSYGGGASTPYTAGLRSNGGLYPGFLTGAALGFFPGLWLYGAYVYTLPHPYTYRNTTTGQNETHPVECLCGQYAECGCDQNADAGYADQVANNATIARKALVNGTETLVINGTLDNGTTAAGAAVGLRGGMSGLGGWSVVVAGVVYTMYFM